MKEERRGADVVFPLRVSLRDVCVGRVLELTYTRRVRCPRSRECAGAPGACPECVGPGVRLTTRPIAPGFVQQV